MRGSRIRKNSNRKVLLKSSRGYLGNLNQLLKSHFVIIITNKIILFGNSSLS